jgi:hypothetical protein
MMKLWGNLYVGGKYEKIQGLDGAFLGLENQYVEYLMRVSSEYLISFVLPSLTS